MSDIDVQPAPRRSTVEHIAEELRAAVVSGHLAAGAQLGEADLARRFQVSRGPLREAMQRLVSEGILVAIANRGVFVVDLALEDMVDVYRARHAIEGGALDVVLRGRRQETYDALEPVMESMRAAAAADDGPGVSDADQRFHEVLVTSSGSPRLARAMRTLLVETRLCLGELRTTYPDLATQVREHEDLQAAIRDGRPPRVRALLRDHLDHAVLALSEKHARP